MIVTICTTKETHIMWIPGLLTVQIVTIGVGSSTMTSSEPPENKKIKSWKFLFKWIICYFYLQNTYILTIIFFFIPSPPGVKTFSAGSGVVHLITKLYFLISQVPTDISTSILRILIQTSFFKLMWFFFVNLIFSDFLKLMRTFSNNFLNPKLVHRWTWTSYLDLFKNMHKNLYFSSIRYFV